MIVDFQFGSTGKGLIAGYLASRESYDTVTCAFATNAGHTYRCGETTVMTQQLPTGIISPTVKNVMIGPGALIHVDTLRKEIERYGHYLEGKRLLIHPHAAIVEDYHAFEELHGGQTKMGSTAKGVGAAAIERILRKQDDPNIADRRLTGYLRQYLVDAEEYRHTMNLSDSCLVEGAQGFSLSMYHGNYPYVTSRDVTPWQIAADCGLPMKWASTIAVIGTLRTFPIRVNNRDGYSGPAYDDQLEIEWTDLGIEPELTTVTKLPRRIFTFSHQQYEEALWHCGSYWKTRLFLNFANYAPTPLGVGRLITKLETPTELMMNHANVEWVGVGPDDSDVMPVNEWRELYLGAVDSEGGHAD